MTAPVSRGPTRIRLHFLDGIRGLAALYVLVFHSLTIGIGVGADDVDFSWPMRMLRGWFGYGHFAVAVFIVLSGFSLMLPLARRGRAELTGGFGPYLVRRGRRVLPPYYAALVLSIVAVVAASTLLGAEKNSEALSPGSIGSHLFLVHNWSSDWVFRINGPMWSVATEWQIYFLFPLVLLPLWGRLRPATIVAVVWGAAFALHFGMPDNANLAWAAPWFAGSFAAGMWGAWTAYRPGVEETSDARRWGLLAALAFALLVAILSRDPGSTPLPVLDLIVTVGSVAGILMCIRIHRSRSERGSPGAGYRFLESRQVIWLGAVSYSVYLVQHPLLRLSEQVLGRSGLGVEAALWVQFLIGTPLIVALAWLFAEFFELPFTTGSHLLPRLRSLVPTSTSTAPAQSPTEPRVGG